MKKALKITGIVLASLVGVVLIVAGIASALITSSGWLTKQVKKYAPEFVTCQTELGKADLTLFKTFPNVGIDIENVALINPMVGSPSDTLANIDDLTVVLDLKKLLKEKEIVIRKCILEDAFVNLYIDTLGNNNFNVFKTKEDNDTTKTTFDYLVDIEEVKLKNTDLIYTDNRNEMTAHSRGLNLDLKGKMQDKDIDADLSLNAEDLTLKMKAIQLALNTLDLGFDGKVAQYDQIDGTLKLTTPDICLNLNEPYLKHDTLSLNLPVLFSLNDMKGHLEKAQIGLNRYIIDVDGDVAIAENNDVNLDLALNTNTLVVEDVLTYLPEKVQQKLSGIEYTGKATLSDVEVKGTFNDSLMPLIKAKVLTDNLKVNVKQLPYPFTEVNLDGDLDLDLNSDANSLTVNSVSAKFNRSSFTADGVVDDLLGDIGLKLNGRTNLDLTTNFTVENLMKSLDDYNLNRLSAKANLKANNFTFDMDTIHASAPMLNVGLTLPASAKQKGQKGAYITLATSKIDATVGKGVKADLRNPDIKLAADNFKGGLEKMLLNADLKFSHLDVVANMGKEYAVNSNSLKVNASVSENKVKTDFLNHWNPSADFVLGTALLKVDGIDELIRISNIDFLFNSHELDFKRSTFRIGQSDMSMQGSVVGIKEWIEDHKNLMKGELQVSSEFLDINEIMDLTSGLGRTDENGASTGSATESQPENKEDNPFMVPEGIDFNFVLNTQRALYDNFDMNNLKGTMTVKDGTLLLREIGFTNKAAEMQLTAMYQSPRKNNLFLAMDFHLLRVQINDLLTMIPYIDTLVPMLKTFDGQAEFHIGAETNLKSNYEPKISTLRAAADIEGKNLTVNDKFTFTKITDMLDISTNGSYRVDSLDVQLTAFKNEIDLWPSQIAIGKYKVTVDGRMTLDRNGEYHLSVTQSPLPVRLGLKISGPFNKLEYKLEDCKYPNLYKPNKRNDTEQMYYELKKKIADRLKSNVR